MAGYKGATLDNQWLALFFNATPIPNVADNAASSPFTNWYISLHTADPTATGNQTSFEISYTGYARVAVARTSSGFTVSGSSVSPVANIIFPTPTGAAGQTATFWMIGSASTGTGQLEYAGPLSPGIVITLGLPPTITTASTVTEA